MLCGCLKKRVLVLYNEVSARRAIYLLLAGDHCGTYYPLIKWRYYSILLVSVLRTSLSACIVALLMVLRLKYFAFRMIFLVLVRNFAHVS